jgi:hypothetical protein
MVTLIILFIVLVLALIFLPFTKALMKDKQDLRDSPIEVRFKVLIDEINKAILDGKGKTVYPVENDKRWLNLHSDDKANYLIQFNYSTGNLTIYLKYLYLHKELNANVPFYSVRTVDAFTQKRMANEFIQKMRVAITKHQETIGIPEQSAPIHSQYEDDLLDEEDDPLDMVSSMYGDLSMHQKKSVINMAFLIFSAKGSSWNEFVNYGPTRTQLNFLNLNWQDCQQQLNSEGENAIYSDLRGLRDGVYDSLLMFWLSMVMTEYGPDDYRADKFVSMNEKLGHSEEDVEQRIQKIQAMMNYFGQG